MLLVLAGLAGAAWGFAADRIAARWPAHEDGSIRPVDWRTPLVVVLGALAFAGSLARFATPTSDLLIMGVYVVALVLLFATDLDQKLLPDVITLPLIPFSAIVSVAGASPFISGNEDLVWAGIAAIAVPLGMAILARPLGPGAIGQGDLKLLVSVGLLTGARKLIDGLIAGAVAAGVVVIVLLVLRRITMKTFLPYGPFLIGGVLWAILALPRP